MVCEKQKKGKYFGQWPRSFKNAVAKIALKGFVESALSLIIKNLDAADYWTLLQ